MAEQKRVNEALIRMSKETGIPLIATNDSHYIYKEDAVPHDILLCIQTGKTVEDEDRMRYEGGQFYVKSPEEMYDLFGDVPEALENTVKIAKRCNVEFVFHDLKLPRFDVPEGKTAPEYLRELCYDGFAMRYPDPKPEWKERLEYELHTIETMGYVDYFLIVWDFIKYAKDHGIIVGPGRGSAAGSAASGSTIKVGVMGPLTGDASVYGKAVVNGATLYLKQVNEKGGVNGKQLEAVTMDEQGDETQAVTCFTKMVDQGITALVGDVTTAPTLAVAAESAEYNVPMVTASATAEAVTYDAETDTVNENVFRACFTDPFQGVKMADYAYEKLGYTKAAVIFLKGKDYNEGLAENFAKEFEAKGGTIVDQESYSEGDVDFKTQLTSILGKGPEMVFCPNYYQDVGQILAQAESVGLTVPFLGGDGWDGLEGYATADQLKDSYFCACYAKGSSTEFEDAYKAEYGEAYPNGFAPLGYDAAMTVVYGIQAAEDAGLEAGTDEYKQAVIDAIAGGTIQGITGTFTFDEHHNPVKSTAILTYVDGKPELKEMF